VENALFAFKLMKTLKIYSWIIAATAIGTVGARADTVVVPSDYATTEAPSGAFLFERVQLLYEGSHFSFGGASAADISELRFRVNNPGFAFSGTLDMEVRLSTTSVTEGLFAGQRLFAANTGADEKIALSRNQVNVSSSYSDSGINSFSIVVPLPNGFRYAPAAGNLLVDVRTFGGSGSPGLPRFDGVAQAGDGIAMMSAGSPDAAIGSAETLGMVAQFTFEPVPEPAILGLLIVGIATVVGHHRCLL
jgi:hypothetical protein